MKPAASYQSHSSEDLSTTTTTSKDTKKKSCMDMMSGDFKDIRPMPAFVDKTMLLDTIMEEKYRNVCLIAPRRFGKSVNLSMLKRFWEVLPDKRAMTENRELFERTKIAEECSDLVTEHRGKYPIILLDFLSSTTDVTCYGSVLERLRTIVHKAYEKHEYLKNSDKLVEDQKKNVEEWCGDRTFESLPISSENIKRALENLAKYLFKHHKQRVIVLVDEYDSICSKAIMDIKDIKEDQNLPGQGPDKRLEHKATEEIDKIIRLCMDSIGCLLKGNENVYRGVLTGVSYLTTMGLSTLLNNVRTFKFQDKHDFTPFYGITLEELKEVLSRESVSMDSKYVEIKENYNGYRWQMLSTWSVMCYVNDGGNRDYTSTSYWVMSGIVIGLEEAFRIPTVRSIVLHLLRGNIREMNYIDRIKPLHIVSLKNLLHSSTEELGEVDVDVFLNFLLEQGYLKIMDQAECSRIEEKKIDKDESSRIGEEIIIKVQIPNLEIRRELSEELRSYYQQQFKLDTSLAIECVALFDKFSQKDDENKKLLKEISVTLNQLINKAKFNHQSEASLHTAINYILWQYSKAFECFTQLGNRRRGEGVLDILLVSKNRVDIGIIIELKVGKTARDGLEQIIEKDYRKTFVNYDITPSKIGYYVFIGLNMSKDEEQKITLCTLLNSNTLGECFNC